MIDFVKSHGTGNDFVLVPDLDNRIVLSPGAARLLCDRHFGIGADAVIRIGKSEDGLFFMDYLNADGSYAEMCGNGVRSVGKWLGDHGHASDRVQLLTGDGVKQLELYRGAESQVETVVVDMGTPAFADDVTETLNVNGEMYEFSFVSMGNPHAVLFVDDVDAVPLQVVGEGLQSARARFPQSVNVEVAHVRSDGLIDERTFERGVGETLACGTGACAVAVAAQRRGLVDDTVDMNVRGGRLRLQWRPGKSVFMTGPAVEVFSGQLDPTRFGLQLLP